MPTTKVTRITIMVAGALALPLLAARGHPAHDRHHTQQAKPAYEIGITDSHLLALQQRAAREDATAKDLHRLGWSLIAEARKTQDERYFELAAQTAHEMQDRFGSSSTARLLLAHALHNLHRFAEAEAIATVLAEERGDPMDYALLSDVFLERGKLDEAVAACRKFVRLKPGLEAYSRVSYLRWLHGDIDGAIAAMEHAVLAGTGSNPEPLAWCLCRLSYLYLQKQRQAEARAAAKKAVALLDEYPPALFALGRAELAMGDLHSAAELLNRAAELNPIPEYQWWQGDALETVDRNLEAAAVRDDLEQKGAFVDPRTVALFLASRDARADKALSLARNELGKRPDTFSWDALAWAQHAAGETRAAHESIQEALRFNIRDARVFLHAGIIARGLGRETEAKGFFDEAATLSATLTPLEQRLLADQRRGVSAASSSHEKSPQAQSNKNRSNEQS